MRKRELTAGETTVLGIIQKGYGPQNTADEVFFRDAGAPPFAGVVEPKKAPSRESHGHQELSRVKKVITAFFRPKKEASCKPWRG